MKKSFLALSTALSLFAITPAFAQSTTTTPSAPAIDCTLAANANDPACLNKTGDAATTPKVDASDAAVTGSVTPAPADLIVPADRLNGAKMMSANDFIGKRVYDQTGADIGEVNDMIISESGDIQAVILGVGGFLGIGEKDVAVSTRSIQMVPDGNGTKLVVDTTKDVLKGAPTYDKANRRYM